MKKRIIILLIFLLILCGCRSSDGSGNQQTTPGTDNVQCSHLEAQVGGTPRYVYGKYCDDPVEIYLTCQLCGEQVFRGTMENDIQCFVGHGLETVVKEPTCTEVGQAQGNCLVCGKLKEWELPMTEHDYFWFYGADEPSCRGCGLEMQVCAHEFVQVGDVSFTEGAVGKKKYQCSLCEETCSVYYDALGEFDLQTVLDEVYTRAQQFGWTTVLDWGLNYGDELANVNRSFKFRDIDSVQAAKLFSDAGLEMLEELNLQFYDPNNNRSDYMLTVTVEVSRGTESYFEVQLSVRSME